MPKYVPIRTQVLKEVEAYLKASKMSPSKFGQLVMGDTRFVPRLRDPEGQPIKSSTIDKIRVWIPGEGRKYLRKSTTPAPPKRTIKKRVRREPPPSRMPRRRRRLVSAPRPSA